MKPSLRRAAIGLVLLAVVASSTACIGSFRVTQMAYGFNKSVGGKVVQELVFLGMIIIPVYEVAILADVLIFNTIEFWGSGARLSRVETLGDGSEAHLAVVSKDVLRVRHVRGGVVVDEIELVREGDTSGHVRRSSGEIVAVVRSGDPR